MAAFKMGVMDRHAFKAFLANPYKRGSRDWYYWRHGWLAASDATSEYAFHRVLSW